LSYFIAGSIFLLLSLIAKFVEYRSGINQKYEEAKNDKKKAIDAGDADGVLDSDRRMRLYR
jgi:hypothetical protein